MGGEVAASRAGAVDREQAARVRLLLGLGVTGYDEASVRLPFAIVGIVTVPVVAVCGRRLIGPWPAVVAALLFAANPWHIFWSQNARGYVLALLLNAFGILRASDGVQEAGMDTDLDAEAYPEEIRSNTSTAGKL